MLLAFWLVATTSLVTVAVWKSPDVRAIIGMGWGRIILWIGVSGSLTYLFRERIRQLTVRIPLGWRFWSRRFTSFQVFVLFGVTGTLAECTFGFEHLREFGEGIAPWKALIATLESVGGVEFYLMEQEGTRYPEFETAQRCLDTWETMRN